MGSQFFLLAMRWALERGRGVALPIVDHVGRLHPEGTSFSGKGSLHKRVGISQLKNRNGQGKLPYFRY